MIIVKLYGGLGNQLFQWAFGQGLSFSRQTDLKFDASSYNLDELRNFELANVVRKVELASHLEIKESRKESNPATVLFRKVKTGLLPYFKRDIICEKTYLFDKKLLEKANSNAYFEGYWQNSKYFEYLRSKLIESIKFPNSTNTEFIRLKQHFIQNDISSIHIRRGDYIQNPELLKIHGLCSAEYYHRAIDKIQKAHPNTSFYVFSDDIDWCKTNLKTEVELNYVDNTKTMYEDLELLSLSKNNITANSSFSWWGAWLNTNETKTVISPKKWFNQTEIDYSEIVPKNWIRL